MRATTTGPDPRLPGIGAPLDTSPSGDYVTVTPGYSNAAGGWTELVASTTAECHWMLFGLANFSVSTVGDGGFADIAIGAAASEVAIVTNWAVGGAGTAATTGVAVYAMLPVRVPPGSRISFRYSTPNASAPTSCLVRLQTFRKAVGDTASSPRTLTAVGVTGTNTGTTVNTDNTWTELTSSTTQPYRGLIPAFRTDDGAFPAASGLHQIGVGASGGETSVSSTMVYSLASESYAASIEPTVVHIPAGSRLSARSNGGANRIYQHAPLAIPYT